MVVVGLAVLILSMFSWYRESKFVGIYQGGTFALHGIALVAGAVAAAVGAEGLWWPGAAGWSIPSGVAALSMPLLFVRELRGENRPGSAALALAIVAGALLLVLGVTALAEVLPFKRWLAAPALSAADMGVRLALLALIVAGLGVAVGEWRLAGVALVSFSGIIAGFTGLELHRHGRPWTPATRLGGRSHWYRFLYVVLQVAVVAAAVAVILPLGMR